MSGRSFGVRWAAALAVVLASGLRVAEATLPGRIEGDTLESDAGRGSLPRGAVVEPHLERAAAGTGLRLRLEESATDDRLTAPRAPLRLTVPRTAPRSSSAGDPAAASAPGELAQFQLPGQPREGLQYREGAPAELVSDLRLSYGYGSDSEIAYRKDSDLNKAVRDNSTTFTPTLFGFVDYRPTAWLEARLEMTLQVFIPVNVEAQVTLPNGEVTFPGQKTQTSLLVDQMYVTIKNVIAPFEFTVGVRNFEDPRLWLYDVALGGAIVKYKHDRFQSEASATRENLFGDMDLIQHIPRGRVDNYIWYTEYRAIEDHRFAGYAIYRFDNAKPSTEGRPWFFGVRAFGRPSTAFNYWADLGIVRGKDELQQKLSGYGFDVGFTYRFPDLALSPNFTLGFAFGSGDGNPADSTNTAFRQTGLQSNEGRFGGVTQFKYYGEALDPELSNLEIFTFGIGFRPLPNFFVDLVYHRYRLNRIAEEVRGSPITALMNQGDTPFSKDVGSEFDVILGFRNMFGIRRLGFEVRAGWFFPGNAFLRNDGTETNPIIRKPDTAVSVLAVIIF